ncbi:hypothetical protein [Rhizobium paknamense]|uniref:Uncharacterized protein n=1 Tax=Rhizobium paknamense TaxID=1206817 RepID=A0ABU0IA57_9HYPH|nr:hypothetical protein [Rhizobium paknamense]MDQ0455118.1 hypothetical protein [Rhizobium paknamense]
MQEPDPILPSLLARSALVRLAFALGLIGLTWLAIQWAVALP